MVYIERQVRLRYNGNSESNGTWESRQKAIANVKLTDLTPNRTGNLLVQIHPTVNNIRLGGVESE